MLVSHISLIEDVTELSSALVEASRLELELTGSKPVALPLGYAPMTTPPFYSEERWGLYHVRGYTATPGATHHNSVIDTNVSTRNLVLL